MQRGKTPHPNECPGHDANPLPLLPGLLLPSMVASVRVLSMG